MGAIQCRECERRAGNSALLTRAGVNIPRLIPGNRVDMPAHIMARAAEPGHFLIRAS
jgi:hypothetical protein